MTEEPQQKEQQQIARVAGEIARYLRRVDGNTAETIEGILQWWIPQQRLIEERFRVEQAVQKLCRDGVLLEQILPDGSALYTSIQEKQGNVFAKGGHVDEAGKEDDSI